MALNQVGLERLGTSVTDKIGENKNLIINGSQIISQRATSATGKTTTGFYCTDRFRFLNNNIGTFTLAQSTDAPTGFSKSLRLDCTTADTSIGAGDFLGVDQGIEGFNVQQLDYGLSSAKSITISFYVKSTTTGTYTFEIYMNEGEYFNSKTYTISSANTWERKTITFSGNTSNTIADDNTRGLTCNFWLSNGSNFEGGTFSDGTWHNTANRRVHSSQVNIASSTDNDWSITGLQAEVGSVATDFEHRSFGQELALCQRYFLHYDSSDAIFARYGLGISTSGTTCPTRIEFPVQMRTVPTLTSAGNLQISSAAAGYAVTGLTIETNTCTKNVGQVVATVSSGLTAHKPYYLESNNNNSSKVQFSAEL